MGRIRKTYSVTSVLFLLVLAISPSKDHFREWRRTQQEFNLMIEKLPQKVKPVPVSLKQIWVRDLDRIDRCATCHLGVGTRGLSEAPLPYRTHPKIYHNVEKFGCTVCHDGQGWATDYADAHLPSEFWDRPILPNRYLESSCGRCHESADKRDMPIAYRGRELVAELNCVGCHDLPGFKKRFVPSLDGIGTKLVGRGWIVRWLRNPRDAQGGTRMPDFRLSDEEIDVLADFLMSFKTFSNGTRLDSLPPFYEQRRGAEDFLALGKRRFREARCISCHAVDGRGGHLAPDLGRIASKATAVWIFNYIKTPKRLQPGVEMPQYGFSNEEAAAITAYVEDEFVDWDAPEAGGEAHVAAANAYERGLALFNYYNCGGCHNLSLQKVTENRGPDLSAIGSKRIYEIEFGNAGIPQTLHDYIETKLAAPRVFGESVRMPLYDLDVLDREAITNFLLSLRNETVPQKYVHSRPAPAPYRPQGDIGAIIDKYSCLKCHSIRGTGGTIAPDLSRVGSQLKREWVGRYFKLPYSLRPIVEERMPNLFIADEEIAKLTDYFYAVLVDDDIVLPRTWNDAPEAVERGESLFREKYGCQACHIVGGRGGYVGPPLDKAGDRLQPAWVFHWLMDPQKYKPDTIEPRSGMSEEEATNVVAYLMSLRSEPEP